MDCLENSTNKALFLDRDGVILEYIPYLSRVEQVKIPPHAGIALKKWQEAGYLLIIITNQAGVGRGYFSLTDVEAVHQALRQEYAQWGVNFTDVFLCPHHPESDCDCRKPSPKMILEAAQKYQIALEQSFFVGDAPSDLECAMNSGCQPVLVLSGRGQATLEQIHQYPVKIPVYGELHETVELIGQIP